MQDEKRRNVASLSTYRNTPGNSAQSVLEALEQLQPLETIKLEYIALEDVRDAMHRTIAGMLGMLPNEQFSVTIDMQRDSLARLIISSMVTGKSLYLEHKCRYKNLAHTICLNANLEQAMRCITLKID